MITHELHSPYPPTEVLATMRAHAGEWRRSRIPAELSKAGIIAVDCSVKGSICTLHYERSWSGPGAVGQQLGARANVEPEAGGSRITVTVAHRPLDMTLPMVGAAFLTLLGVLGFGPIALLLPLFPLAAGGLATLWLRATDNDLSRRSPEVDYLVRRIEDAVLGLDEARVSAGAPAPQS